MSSKESTEGEVISMDAPRVFELGDDVPLPVPGGSVPQENDKRAVEQEGHDSKSIPETVEIDTLSISHALETKLENAWHDAERERQDRDAQRRASFDTLCALLRTNDPSITHVDTCDFPENYCCALALSLMFNTNVSVVSLDLSNLEDNEVEYMDQFLVSRTGLRRVELFTAQDDSVNMNVSSFCMFTTCINFLQSVAQTSTIQELECRCEVTSFLLRSLVLASSLQVFEVDLDMVLCNPSAIDDVANAFGMNVTFRSLKFHVQDNLPLLKSILMQLREGCSCLSDLTLCSKQVNVDCMSAVNSLLQSRDFMNFGLEDFYFSFDAMQLLSEGLRHGAIHKLSLQNCVMSPSATMAFISYMQTQSTSTKEIGEGPHWLQELFMASDKHMFVGYKSMGEAAAAMLADPLSAYMISNNTIGSQLRSLSLMSCCGLNDFCKSVAKHATCLQLEKLEIGRMNQADCIELMVILPHLPSLEQLVIEQATKDVAEKTFLEGMQQNGSLHNVAVRCNSFSTATLAFVGAYCTRSRLLRNVLTAEDCGNDPVSQTTICNANEYLLPKLLTVACQTPSSKLCSISSSLLSWGDSIGLGNFS
jgi:hypothetical protein